MIKRRYAASVEEEERERAIRIRVDDLPRLQKKWHAGMRIRMKAKNFCDLANGDSYGYEDMTIVKPYKFHVSCRRKSGRMESYSYPELERLARIMR